MDNDGKGSAGARDGLIDFGGYTTKQLLDLESSIDPERFPLNHAHLVEELKQRERAGANSPSPRPMGRSIFAFGELLEPGSSKASWEMVLRTRLLGDPARRNYAVRMAARPNRSETWGEMMRP
jgi:hypothetical protein